MPLVRRPRTFSHPDYIFELKYDGFRALLFVDQGQGRFVSRNSNTLKSSKD